MALEDWLWPEPKPFVHFYEKVKTCEFTPRGMRVTLEGGDEWVIPDISGRVRVHRMRELECGGDIGHKPSLLMTDEELLEQMREIAESLLNGGDYGNSE